MSGSQSASKWRFGGGLRRDHTALNALVESLRVAAQGGSQQCSHAVAGPDGYFRLSSLQPGRYDVMVAKDGFAAAKVQNLSALSNTGAPIPGRAD